ncbi:MAG: oligopeptide ABC transporter substrate-binding protein [Lactobacillus sp.]|nr:oligopeptide ABC transporter substrate-binding protein [Lactobacillus sp.]
MKVYKTLSTIGVVSAAAVALVACGKSGDNSKDSGSKDAKKLATAVPKKAIKDGGTVTVAELTDTPFTGIFNEGLSTSATDSDLMSPGAESLFDTDDNYKITDNGPATFKLDKSAKTITIEVKKGVKWSDGKQVTAKDVEYSYEIVANKDSGSQRYTGSLANVVGLAEYHAGKSKTISGIDLPDGDNGRKVVIHFKQMKPGMYQSGNGYFLEFASPYHYLKDVAFSKLMSSDKIRKSPLFFGPYKLSKIVRGQSVTWVPNKYYWRGKPHLDKITYSVLSPNSSAQAIKSHKFDEISVVNSQWKQVKGTKGYNFIAAKPLSYSYLAFKVGKYDTKKGVSVMDKNAKMNNQALRQAIGYAMNIDEVSQHYTQGLSFRLKTLIPDRFKNFYNSKIKGYYYDLKKANKLLDDAGYKKKGTYRVQPNGKPLTIHLAAMTGTSNQEAIIQNYIQQWKKIGLHVVLTGGRLIEFNSFYDKVEKDDPSIDMFFGGWSLSSEPSPKDLYSKEAPFNFSRFVTAENTKLLNEIDSDKAFNESYRAEKFKEWQQYMYEQAYVIPTTNGYSIDAVNSKLTGVYASKPSLGNQAWYLVGYAK